MAFESELLADGSAAHSAQTRQLSTIQRIAMKTVLGCYRTTPTAAMELKSGLPPPWICLQTKVLCSFTRMQSLAQSHPIHDSLTNGLLEACKDAKVQQD